MALRHKLLARQIARHLPVVPDGLESFLSAVDQAYRAADDDRALLERAMTLASGELCQANDSLRLQIQMLEAARDGLARQEREYRAALEICPSGIALLSGDHIQWLNAAWASWLGYSPSELQGTSSLALVHPEDRPMVLARRSATTKPGPAVTRFLHRTGGVVGIEVTPGVPHEWAGEPCILLVARLIG